MRPRRALARFGRVGRTEVEVGQGANPAWSWTGSALSRVRPELIAGVLIVVLPLIVGVAAGECCAGAAAAVPKPGESLAGLALNNLGVGVVALSGAVTMGMTTLMVVVPGWFLVGLEIGAAITQDGVGAVVAGLLLHAPFELAGFSLCTAVGLMPAAHLMRAVSTQPPRAGRLWRSMGLVCVIGIALLLLAAVIETQVTPHLQQFVTSTRSHV